MASDLNAIDSDNSEKLFSATELNTSAKPPKTKAEYQKEYRERQKAKKYENKQESSAKPPKTKAEYQKEYRERQKAKKYENKQESSAKPPKTNAEYQKEFRERQKAKKNENKQESTAKPPKTNAEHQMAFRERQKLKKIINKRESKMNMIEVDPKLFITCRLCLDEMGLYQIVPKVQMQIKYCFEIDVQPFDGLPQLICKKCESILSQYAGIKQMYQVKQNSLKNNKKNAQDIPDEKTKELNEDTIQQQDTVSSTQQVESVNGSSSSVKKTNKLKLSLIKKVRSGDCESSVSKNNDHSAPIKPTTTKNQVKSKLINKPTREKLAWASNYTKQFVCKICSKSFSEKRYIISHFNKHENFLIKYSSYLNTHCEIKMNKVGSTLNVTNSKKNVVLSEKKIIRSVNSKYYILYSSNTKKESSAPESSDEDLIGNVGKYKRQRLLSEDSISLPVDTVKENIQTSIDIEKQPQINNSIECDNEKSDSFIDCVNIDSDSTSTQSIKITKVSESEKPQKKLLYVNKKLINNIITMCYKKYLKRFDNSKSASKLHGNMDSFLQHKVLSVGTKIINSKGLNSMGLLRYLEHKNLDISWTQTKNSNSPIIVGTSSVNAKSTDNDINDLGWRSLSKRDQNHTTQDFVDVFENLPPQESSPEHEERVLVEESPRLYCNDNNIEKEITANISPIALTEKNKKNKNTNSYNPMQNKSMVTEKSENAVLVLRTSQEGDKQTCKKILNASPVPYPKQLPTKKSTVHEAPSLLKSPTHAPVPIEASGLETSFVNFNNEVVHMPVITSTVSLAPLAEDQRQKLTNSTSTQVTHANKTETNLPQIKVKPISELMPDRSVQNNASLVNMGGWTVTSSNNNEAILLQATKSNLMYVANVPQYTTVASQQPAALCYPQILCNVSPVIAGEADKSRLEQSDGNERAQRKNQECVHMHTVELPNTKTTSPFRYFQRLLQIHNLVLLESTVGVSYISSHLKCLIKFTLGFQQENNAPVTLCLTLYCDKSVFCIKVRDNVAKDIDVSALSANWQWEILKVFKGDIVNKLNMNALKHGVEMSSKVNHFISLLKAIVFSKEK